MKSWIRFQNLKTKKEKVAWLKQNNSDGLRMVIKSSFDPKMKYGYSQRVMFHSTVTMHQRERNTQTYIQSSRKLYHFIEGGNFDITQSKRENLFIQVLEGLQENDADVLVSAKDKSLHRKFKGLSDNVVKRSISIGMITT